MSSDAWNEVEREYQREASRDYDKIRRLEAEIERLEDKVENREMLRGMQDAEIERLRGEHQQLQRDTWALEQKLRARNAELLAALNGIANETDITTARYKARAAITKVEGK
jgi:hypothetical protein